MGSTYFIKRLFNTKRKPSYGRGRAERPKSFKTEEGAKKWAEQNKIKKYSLKDLKENSKERKIIVVAEK